MPDTTVIATLTLQPAYDVGSPDSDVVTIHDPGEGEWPFPACPLGAVAPFAQVSFWYWGEFGHDELEADGFFYAPTTIGIRRPGTTAPTTPGTESISNGATGLSLKVGSPTGISNLPHDCVVSCQYTHVSGVYNQDAARTAWGYISFEHVPFWETHPLQIDWLAIGTGLFDPSLAAGVEVWCADPAGDPGEVVASLAEFWHLTGSGAMVAPWIEHDLFDPLVRVSGAAQVSTLGPLYVSLVDEALGADQWAASQIGTGLPSANLVNHVLLLRASTSAQTWYQCRVYSDAVGGGAFAIDKVVAGVVTNLAIQTYDMPNFFQNGEEIEAEAIGTTIRLLRNGKVVIEATDSAIASGKIGLAIQTDWSATTSGRSFGFAGGDGAATRRTFEGGDNDRLYSFGRSEEVDTYAGEGQHAIITGNPTTLVQPQELLYTLTQPSDLPIVIPVPAGRALIFRTVNQDPQTMPLGTSIFADLFVGFLNPDPPGAYKVLSSADAGGTVNWTAAAENQLRIRNLIHEVNFGGVFALRKTVLIYRDPARFLGTTLRFPITDPYLWFAEDPEDTFIGGGMEATLTAYAVDESELVGTTEEQWTIVKAWGYTDVESRLGAELGHVDFVTSSESAFASGSGNFDVAIAAAKLVYYKITAADQPANPGAGLHLPALFHSNASLF